MRTIALAAAALALAACSLTTRGGLLVGPADQLVTATELKALYESHGFAEGGKFTEGPKNPSPIIRRNELQNVLLGMATDKCTEFKTDLATRIKSGKLRFGMGTQLLAAAGAVVQHELTAKAFSATGAATSAVASVYGDAYEVQALNVAMSGIERARTRVFLNILKDVGKCLEKYPVARAVNDARRYHSVCTLTDGLIEASRAANSTPRVE